MTKSTLRAIVFGLACGAAVAEMAVALAVPGPHAEAFAHLGWAAAFIGLAVVMMELDQRSQAEEGDSR